MACGGVGGQQVGGQGLPGATHPNNMQLIKHTLWNMVLGQRRRLQAVDKRATCGKWTILTDKLKAEESKWMDVFFLFFCFLCFFWWRSPERAYSLVFPKQGKFYSRM